ncbi:hypothetical protein I4U23_007692 [Adineta vaga]|nr:hypothetical protein I4U23_007692 [Adineta vaga]
MNDDIIPIGILKKNKLDINDRENIQKRFCNERLLDTNENDGMKTIILNNVNQCVENLSKILSESCSSDEDQLTILETSSSIICPINNNNNNNNHHKQNSSCIDDLNSKYEHDNVNFIQTLPDGIILHHGEHFGVSLGEPMIRKNNLHENHSINELNQLLSKTNCFLLQQYHIEFIEDLIRLYLEQGQDHFTALMINLFQVDPLIVQQLNNVLLKWVEKLT